MNRLALAISLLLTTPAFSQDQQVGARTKAMGGSYTAFEDDPVSVWLNPAGIATQPDGFSLVYQTVTVYQREQQEGEVAAYRPQPAMAEPPIVPSFIGVTMQIGTPELPQAVGFCLATPFRLKMGYIEDGVLDPEEVFFVADQAFYRLRFAYAIDFLAKPSGFFTHVSLGVGLDIGITSWNYTKAETIDLDPGPAFDPGQTFTQTVSATQTTVAGGFGILVGLYDNTDDLKVNFGVAVQTRADFKFRANLDPIPLADWPGQIQAGFTLYLLHSFPLRFTFDAQILQWDSATQDSTVPGASNYQDSTNLSVGAEYRIKVSRGVTLFPRAGFRLWDAPWEDQDALPAIGNVQLSIDSKSDKFFMGTFGLGVGWSNPAGARRSFDVGAEIGGDALGLAFGYTMEM